MPLIDIVNFNADASCLSSAKWLKCLEGGKNSLLLKMLNNYVLFGRKVNLGLIGATIKDIAFFNPEAIDYINDHQDTFQLMVRPFAHDSPLLRLPDGFRYNLEIGLRCIRHYFSNVNNYYLAPEIMVKSEQVHILKELGIQGIFLHKSRYDESIRIRIPDIPFILKGVFSTPMLCIPFVERELEIKYLSALHGVGRPETWCKEVKGKSSENLFLWRDGESCFLLPLGIEHEAMIFESELSAGIKREFLSEICFEVKETSIKEDNTFLRYFPLHSMKPWLNEMKLYWYVSRVRDIERVITSILPWEKLFWLLIINSDILSSVEKDPPVIEVCPRVFQVNSDNFLWNGVIPIHDGNKVMLARSERAGEGEDYLAYFELLRENKITPQEICATWASSDKPHLQKAYTRIYDEILELCVNKTIQQGGNLINLHV